MTSELQMQENKRFKVDSVTRDCIKRLSPQARRIAHKMLTDNIVISSATNKQDIERDFDLLEYACGLADGSKGTISEQLYEYSPEDYVNPLNPNVNSSILGGTGQMKATAAMDKGSIVLGKTLTKPMTDPIRVFTTLRDIRNNEAKSKEREHKKLIEQAELDWDRYNSHTRYENRVNVDGTFIDKEYFISHLYQCKWCSKRFTEEKERYNHALRTHGCVS
jgi:hypothetical protein